MNIFRLREIRDRHQPSRPRSYTECIADFADFIITSGIYVTKFELDKLNGTLDLGTYVVSEEFITQYDRTAWLVMYREYLKRTDRLI